MPHDLSWDGIGLVVKYVEHLLPTLPLPRLMHDNFTHDVEKNDNEVF